MHFNDIISVALLIVSVTAQSTQNEKRQLGGLSPLLGVISQVLPQGSGTGAALPGASTLPGVSTDATAQASCDKAVQKINDAILLSAALTTKNGGKATTQDILIVLAVLQKSLGESCNVAGLASGDVTGSVGGGITRGSKRDMASEQETADGGPLTGIIGTGNNPNGILGDLTGGSRGDDGEDDRETSIEMLQARDTTALAKCTACEAALYSIVKQLQILFKSSGNTSTPLFGSPRLTAAVQRLRMETVDNMNEKRCEGAKC